MKRTVKDNLVTALRQGYQGATFGFGDEVIDYPTAVIVAKLTGQKVGDVLKEARQISKENLAQDWEKAPGISVASNIAGGIPFGLSSGGKAIFNSIRNGGLARGIAQGAKIGAGLGAVSGAGTASVDPNAGLVDALLSRATGSAIGASIGGVAGGATAPLARLGANPNVDYGKVTKKVTGQQQTAAEKELARILSARPDLQENLTRAQAMDAASKQTGIPLTLAEKIAQSPSDQLLNVQRSVGSNPMSSGGLEAIYAARSGSGDTQGQIQQALMAQAQKYAPTASSYDDVAGQLINKSGEASKKITRGLVEEARPLYQAVETLEVDPNILTDPVVADAVNTVLKNPAYQREISQGYAPNSIKVLDLAYKAIRDKAQTAMQGGDRNMARLLGNAAEDLVGKLDEAAPQYAQARAVYSGNPEALQMRGHIGGLADIDPLNAESVNRSLYAGTPKNAELTAKALGADDSKLAVASNIYKSMADLRNDPVNIASKIAPDADARQMLRTYGADEDLMKTLDVINQAKIGEKARFGSPTTANQKADNALKEAASAGVDLATGNNVGMIRKLVSSVTGGSPEEDPQFYADMLELMTTDKGMKLLEKISGAQQGQIQKQMTQKALMSPITTPTSKLSSMTSAPMATAATGAINAPVQEYPEPYMPPKQYNEQQQNDLPPGFVLRQPQQNQELPPGFILRGVK